jgi:hypothetical protein
MTRTMKTSSKFLLRTLLAAILLGATPAMRAAEPPKTGEQSAADAIDMSDTSQFRRKPREKTDHENRMGVLGISLGATATLLGFGIGFFAIWVEYRKRRELLEAIHKERLASLERGIEPPPFPKELVDDAADCGPSRPQSTGLKAGLVLIAVGAGLWLFLPHNGRGPFHSTVGAIPGAIGIAYLVYYVIEGRKHRPGRPVSGRPG